MCLWGSWRRLRTWTGYSAEPTPTHSRVPILDPALPSPLANSVRCRRWEDGTDLPCLYPQDEDDGAAVDGAETAAKEEFVFHKVERYDAAVQYVERTIQTGEPKSVGSPPHCFQRRHRWKPDRRDS